MSLVHVRFHKWPDRLHWHFDMERFAEDEHGIWLAAPAGTTGRRGSDPPKTFENPFIGLVPRDEWWTVIWNASGFTYVDIATPAVWDGDTVTMFDLDLDVIEDRGTGTVEVVDEDEFLDHQVRYAYPPDLVDGARTATATVVAQLEAGAEPFAAAGPNRLAVWVAGTRESPTWAI